MSHTPYILGQVVARGGMAEVYRGLHVGQDGFRRLVAIKRILPHHSQNAEFTEMFKDEAHIGQRLQHANIVKVEGFDIIDGSASIIMEFVDGSDLRALLSSIENKKQSAGKRAFMPNALCIYIIAEAARGLHYAHVRRDDVTGRPLNIVHRDISPQNVLISWEGEVKVTDFGIASADRDFKQTETKAGIVKGKYSYMSPEQISGKKCDPKTDVFALSVVLWEMLAMRRLFTSDNEIEVIEMVRHCKIPTRLKDINPNVTDELESIVLRGLARDPKKRFDSMEAFEKTLRAYLSKAHPTASADDLSQFVKEFLSERREVAQEEMRKILTSTQLPIAAVANPIRKSVELTLEDEKSSKKDFKIGRTQTGLATVGQSLRQSQNPQKINTPLAHSSIGAHRTPTPQQRIGKGHPQQSNSALFLALAAFLLVIAGGVFFKHYKNAAKQALILSVRTAPAFVRVKINDRDYEGGKYLPSPLKLKLEPGLNSIEIMRSGYANEKTLLNTDDGIPRAPLSVRLKATAVFAPVRLTFFGTKNVTVSVNDGFFKASMNEKQNVATIPDITAGTPSKLWVVGPEKKVWFSCEFTPAKTTQSRPTIVKINEQSRTCTVSTPTSGGTP